MAESGEFLALLCEVFGLDPNRAGSIFYTEPFFDLHRKWALFVDGKVTTILTTTPMDFGFGRVIGIAGVGTKQDRQCEGFGQQLLEFVLKASAEQGEKMAMLFAHKETLYHRVGFETVDHVVRAPLQLPSAGALPTALEFDQVQQLYASWAEADPGRLRRDDRRWRYWQMLYRECLPVGNGYMAVEANLCREYLPSSYRAELPAMANLDWYGLRSMSRLLEVPVGTEREELLVMTRNMPQLPQMFMTDQF